MIKSDDRRAILDIICEDLNDIRRKFDDSSDKINNFSAEEIHYMREAEAESMDYDLSMSDATENLQNYISEASSFIDKTIDWAKTEFDGSDEESEDEFGYNRLMIYRVGIVDEINMIQQDLDDFADTFPDTQSQLIDAAIKTGSSDYAPDPVPMLELADKIEGVVLELKECLVKTLEVFVLETESED